jgi:WD40 repeat protein
MQCVRQLHMPTYLALVMSPALQLTRDTPLTCVAVAPGGAQACVSSADGHCCIWELSSGKVAHVLKGHTAK